MIVLFGASSDIGQRLHAELESAGLAVRKVSRRLPDGFKADLATSEGVSEAVAGADKIVSCAHARYTKTILEACRPGTQVVLMGSAWRFSGVPNPRADEVRAAEELFLASDNPGVMLHSSMIYGGFQERNVQRLLSVLRRFPIVPVPGGGRQVVRPIYIDDLVECLFTSVRKSWEKPVAFAVAGPAMTWRDMAMSCAEAKGLKRSFVTIPISPAIKLLELLRYLGVRAPSPDILRRFGESADFSTHEMTSLLGIEPRPFNSGIRSAIQGWDARQSRDPSGFISLK